MAHSKEQRTKSKTRNGAAALTTTLLLGGIIVEIGLVGAFLFYLLNRTSYGIRLSSEAYAAAETGIAEGIERLKRNQCSMGIIIDDPPGLAVGDARVVKMIITDQNGIYNPPPLCDGIVKRMITSTGSRTTKKRKLRAVVEVDTASGAIRPVSVEEVGITSNP